MLTYAHCSGVKAGLREVSYHDLAEIRGLTIIDGADAASGTGSTRTDDCTAGECDSTPRDGITPEISNADRPRVGATAILVSLADEAGSSLRFVRARRNGTSAEIEILRQENPEASREPAAANAPAQAARTATTTRPCLVVALPRAGVRRVVAIDQNGVEAGSVDLR